MSYSSEVLADSPLAYWKLDETSGTTAADSSGNARDATYTGSPTVGATSLLADGSGKAMSVAADSGQHATIASASWMNVNTFTVEALATFSAYDSGNGDIVLSRYTAGDNYPMEMGRQYGGTAYPWIQVVVAGNRYNVAGPSALSNGVTYHLAATYDGSNIRMYVNGSQVGSPQAATGNVSWSSSQFDIGRSAQASSTTPGAVIDEVAFYGTALSGARIAAHAAAATALSATVTVPAAATGTAAGVVPVLSGGSSVSSGAAAATAGGLAPTVDALPGGNEDVLAPSAGASAAGVVPLVSGDANLVVPVAEAVASGVAPTVAATVSATVTPPAAASSAAAVAPDAYAVTPDRTVFPPTATAIASAKVPVPSMGLGTDVSNVFTGRERGGFATVELTVPVVEPIGVATSRVDKAVPLPLPVLVKGRPT